MTVKLTDAKLTAHVLDELEPAERQAVEKALETDDDARRTVEELRAASKLVADARPEEPALALTEPQREAILARAKEVNKRATAPPIPKRVWIPSRLAWAALAILVVVGLAVILMPSLSVYREPLSVHDRTPESAAKALILSSGVTTVDVIRSREVEEGTGLLEESRRFGGGGAGTEFTGTGIELTGRMAGKESLKSLGYIGEKYERDESYGVYLDDEEYSATGVELAGIPILGARLNRQLGQSAAVGQAEPGPPVPSQEAGSPDRYLIKEATLVIETPDVRVAADRLVSAVVASGGYVSNLEESVDSLGKRRITMQVRVPTDQLDTTVVNLETFGKVLNKRVTSHDVTEEYVDTEARNRNLKRTEERLLEHLNRTASLEDIVDIEKELNRVREQIERSEGRLRYLSHRVTFSTIHVTFRETPSAEPVMPPDTFSTGRVASHAARSLVGFGQGLWAFTIWLGVWSVVWAPAIVLLWLVYRYVRPKPAA